MGRDNSVQPTVPLTYKIVLHDYCSIARNFAYYKVDFENLSCISVGNFEENHPPRELFDKYICQRRIQPAVPT